jgi:hypothetical protein
VANDQDQITHVSTSHNSLCDLHQEVHRGGAEFLAGAGVLLTIAACPLGMKRDPEVSGFTNLAKFAAYPFCVLLAVIAIVVHYTWFSK